MEIKIERTDTVQNESTNYPIKSNRRYKVEWISDCEYKLTISDINDWSDSAIFQMYPLGRRIRIVGVTNDYIIEKTNKKYIDTLWIQK